MSTHSRRAFLKAAGGAAAATAMPATIALGAPAPAAHAGHAERFKVPFALGMASYSLRSFTRDQALEMTARLGLARISLKDMHFPLNSSEAEAEGIVARAKAAGLEVSAIGVVYMTTEDEVRQAFTLARWAGLTMIVGAPNVPLLPVAERWVKETGIALAIHNHGPDRDLYPSPESAYRLIEKMDRRMGLCIDVAHTKRLGIEPADSFVQFYDRVLDVHIKDTSAADKRGTTVEIGRGVVDIPRLLRAAVRKGYPHAMHFEHEKDAKDPLAGLAESVGYVRGFLASL
jgi:sugar phosphate isomerase/epimerase